MGLYSTNNATNQRDTSSETERSIGVPMMREEPKERKRLTFQDARCPTRVPSVTLAQLCLFHNNKVDAFDNSWPLVN